MLSKQLPNSNPIIVLEAGATHNGKLSEALEMIDIAAESGADAIKFQTVWAGNISEHRQGSLTYRDSTGEHSRKILDMLRERELSWDDWKEIDWHARCKGVLWFSTPDTPATAKILGNCLYQPPKPPDYSFSCCGIKIAGRDMGRLDLIRAAAYTGLRVLLDTRGGAEELEAALAECGQHGVRITGGHYRRDEIIVHTPTGYPTTDPNLDRISQLVQIYPEHLIGYTSHSPGTLDCTKAIIAGAGYIEKGLTLSRKQPGIEHLMCLEPQEVSDFVSQVRSAYEYQQEQQEKGDT